MLDAVSSGLDKVSSALGGAAPGAAGPAAPMTFYKGEDLGATEAEEPGFQSPNETRPRNTGAPIELIHMGHAHRDTSINFPHADLQDDANLEFSPAASKSHALMFRAALEREALLLASFMTSTQCVMDDLEKTKGGLGGMMEMGADMLGGGGGSAAPKAADVNAFGQAVTAAVKPLNVATINYKLTHKCGIDLHQARCNYRAFLEKLLAPPADGPLGGLMGKLPLLPGLPPAVKDIFNFIQGLAFKPMDVYQGFYVRLAKELEPAIEKAVRSYTVQAITGPETPVFYLWYPKPVTPPVPPGAAAGTGIGFLDDAKKAFDEAKGKVDEVLDFLSVPPPEEAPRGGAYLDQAMRIETPPPPPGTLPPPPKELANLILQGFTASLGMSSVPSPVDKIIIEITTMNNDFLRAVYLKLMERPAVEPIQESAMFRAARAILLDKLVALVMEKISFLQRAKEFAVNVQGKTINPGGALLEEGKDALNDEVLRHMNVALELTMGELVDKLEGARQQAVAANAIAMEVYLGLFPYLLALNFRNTFLPVWDLIMDNTFGKMSGPLGDAVKAAKDGMADIKKKVDEGRETAMRLKKIKDRATNQGLQAGTGGQNLTGYKEDWESDLPPDAVPAKPAVVPFFPLPARIAAGKGEAITLSVWNEVKGNHKWAAAAQPV